MTAKDCNGKRVTCCGFCKNYDIIDYMVPSWHDETKMMHAPQMGCKLNNIPNNNSCIIDEDCPLEDWSE